MQQPADGHETFDALRYIMRVGTRRSSLYSFAPFECLVRVPARMQDPQDGDLVLPNEIERDVLSHSKPPYARRDRVAQLADFRCKTELLERELQLLAVTFGVYGTPPLLGIASNLPQVLTG